MIHDKPHYTEMSDEELRNLEDELWEKINRIESVEHQLKRASTHLEKATRYAQANDFDLEIPSVEEEHIEAVVEKRKELENKHNMVDEELNERES